MGGSGRVVRREGGSGREVRREGRKEEGREGQTEI